MSVFLLVAGPGTVRGVFASRERTIEAAHIILTPGETYRIEDWILDYPVTTDRSRWYVVPGGAT